MKYHANVARNIIFMGGFILFSASAWSHGFIISPAGRAALCQQGTNKNCGSVRYEPQSIEGYKGFPQKGPVDNHIISADKPAFYELDQQSPARWVKQEVNSAEVTFSWKVTAQHKTSQWRYFITRPDWDPSQPLTRLSFENRPFCQFIENGTMAPPIVNHTCKLPSGHTGYHIVLGVWDIADTDKAFYQAIDLNIKI